MTTSEVNNFKMSTEYILTRDGKLMHIQRLAYVDLDEGELVHFKYLKKEKLANGKWRYYYDAEQMKSDFKNATGLSAREKYHDAKRVVDDNKKSLAKAREYKLEAERQHKDASDKLKTAGVSAEKIKDAERNARISKDLLLQYESWNRVDPMKLVSMQTSSALADTYVEGLKKKDQNLKAKAQERVEVTSAAVANFTNTTGKRATELYKAGQEYAEAKKEYYDTPLGKLESAIESGVEWLTNLFKKRKKT